MSDMELEYLARRCRRFADICGSAPFISTAKELLYKAADAIEQQASTIENMNRQLSTKKREFIVNTPKGDLKVWSKFEVDNPDDYPGVFIDAINPDGDVLLCCVEYDSLADGIYCRVYAEGDEPSDSIRFENLDKEEP